MKTIQFTSGIFLGCLLSWLVLGQLIAQPTITDFKIQRLGGADYTTGFTMASSGKDARATALEVPTNTFRITLEFSRAVTPTIGSNAIFDSLPEMADLLTLRLSGGTGTDLLTVADLTSTTANLRHTSGGRLIRFDLKLVSDLLPGRTYTLAIDTSKVAAQSDGTTKPLPFSAVFSTAKAITVLPATPGSSAATTICNSGNPRALPPIAINEQSAGSFVVGSGTLLLAFDDPTIQIVRAPTVAVIGAPGDFLVPVATVTPDGKLELAYNFTAFNEVSGILLSGMEVASTRSTHVNGVRLQPESGFEHFTGMNTTTTLATINTVNITASGGPVRPTKIDGPTTVCTGNTGKNNDFTYVAAPVPGVTGYHWKLPAGFATTDPDATLIPANGHYHTPDNQITLAVEATTPLGSYSLEVKSANDCQISAFARSKNIIVAPAPNPVVSLPAPRFSLKTTTAIPITVTNFPAGGVGVLRGDGVLGDKLYPSLLVAGKNYKVHYDYTVNNCTVTAEVGFEVFDPDALVTGLLSSYCSYDEGIKVVQVEDLATATSVKLFSPGNIQVPLHAKLIALGIYEYSFVPAITLFASHGAGTYRFEVEQISNPPGTKTIVTFELREPPNQIVSGPATVCGDGTTVYNYASSVPATGSDNFHWEVLSGSSGTIVGGIDDGPQVSIIWNGGSTVGIKDTLRLTQTRGGCETITNYPVTIFAAPNPNIQGKSLVCPGETVTYTLDQPGPKNPTSKYLWQVKDGEGGTIIGPTNESTVMVLWEKTGTLEVTQTLNGCTGSGSHSVAVETLPKLTIVGLSEVNNFCVSDTLPIYLTPVFDNNSALLPADYLTSGHFEIRRISGSSKGPTPFLRLGSETYMKPVVKKVAKTSFIPAHPIRQESLIVYSAATPEINQNAGEYELRYQYQSPGKSCPMYSPAYKIIIKPMPTLRFNGLASRYCTNDAPVTLFTFKNGVQTSLLPGLKLRQISTGHETTLNGTLLDPAKLSAGDYELYLASNGGTTGDCPNTSRRDTTVTFSIVAPPSALRIRATRDFNQDTLVFALDTVNTKRGFAQTSWNFGNLLSTSKVVKYPVTLDKNGSIPSINYTLVVQNEASCVTTISQAFKVDFSFEGHCQGMPTRFHDASLITGAGISAWQWDFGDGSSTSNIQNPIYTYTAPGTYWVKLTIKSNLIGGHELAYTLRRRIDIFPVITVSETMPHQENFESISGSYWITHGVVDSAGMQLDKSSWRLQKDQTNNGTWVTDNQRKGDDAQYFDLEQSYVESPCFEINELPRPMLSFRYKMDTDLGGDGVVLLYTVDDGTNWYRLGQQGEGIHWYNSKPILGKPGSRFINDGSNDDQQGWSGKSNDVLQTARFSLDEVLRKIEELGFAPHQNKRVRFRFAFGSNADNVPRSSKLKGFAFDDFEIRSRNRGVVLEYFINESITGATEKDQEAADFANRSPESISLHYHTDFPGADSFNAVSEKDVSGRTFYYGIRDVPRLMIDGEGRDSLPDYSQATQIYSKRTLLPAPFSLTIQSPKLTEQNVLKFTAKIKPLMPFNRSIVVQVVLIDTLAQSSISTSKNYHHIVRKMLPDAAGTFVEAKNWQPGDSLSIELDWNLASDPLASTLDVSRLRVVAFIQDYQTKEVYQATVYRGTLPKRISGTGEITSITQKKTSSSLLIFPNPSTRNYVKVLLPSALHQVPLHQIRWTITDLQGRTLQRGHWASRTNQHVVFLDDLPAGVYLYRLHWKDQVFQGRVNKK